MTGSIINLNKARKARASAVAQVKALENRAKFGRTKGRKSADDAERDKRAQALDDHKREP